MRSVTAEEMQRIEAVAIQEMEIPSLLLVENAALSALRCLDLEKRHSFAVFCGPGNNGADGLAMARHLIGRGKRVGVYLLGRKAQPTEAWAVNFRALEHMTTEIHLLETLGDLEDMLAALPRYNTVIDAMFGTGLNRELKGMAPIVIDNLNQSRIHIVSIDMPSGMDATTGRPYGAFVEASEVITMEYPKRGLVSNPYVDCPVRVVSAGIPNQAKERILGPEWDG